MKVLIINGSPKEGGNTYTALSAAAAELNAAGVDTEILHIGSNVPGCTACGACARQKRGICEVIDDIVGDAHKKMLEADGIVVGTPVYYSGMSGALKCFLDRFFYAGNHDSAMFRHKAAAGVAVARRAGGTAAADEINRYFLLAEMYVSGSNYWNIVYGARPGEAVQDTEGLQTMRVLGRNTAWLLKALSMAKQTGEEPAREPKTPLNFIR